MHGCSHDGFHSGEGRYSAETQTLRYIVTCDACGTELREGLEAVLRQRGVPGWVNGESSVFHIVLAEPGQSRPGTPADLFRLTRGPAATALRQAMLLEGVDLMHTGAVVSAAHTPADVAFTVQAFDRALVRLEANRLLPGG